MSHFHFIIYGPEILNETILMENIVVKLLRLNTSLCDLLAPASSHEAKICDEAIYAVSTSTEIQKSLKHNSNLIEWLYCIFLSY